MLDLSRTQALIGESGARALAAARIAVIGLGGVGGYAAEALWRSGAGTLILADGDSVQPSNLNRQIFALRETVGMSKTDAALLRLRRIDGERRIICVPEFITEENLGLVFGLEPDFVIDAADSVAGKVAVICEAQRLGTGIVSCMGAGNRLDPAQFRRGDIADTAGCGCGLARAVRRGLRARGAGPVRVVYSLERPSESFAEEDGRRVPASAGWTAGAAGLCLAAEAVSYIIAKAAGGADPR